MKVAPFLIIENMLVYDYNPVYYIYIIIKDNLIT